MTNEHKIIRDLFAISSYAVGIIDGLTYQIDNEEIKNRLIDISSGIHNTLDSIMDLHDNKDDQLISESNIPESKL